MIRAGRVLAGLLAACMVSLAGCGPQEVRLQTVPRPAAPRHEVVYRRPQVTVPPVVRVTEPPRPEVKPPQPQPVLIRPLANDWYVAGGPKWTHIIVHHSSDDRGNAEIFDRDHRRRGWDQLGYHFVITNGNGGADGKVEVGPRWPIQKHGAHTRVSTTDDNYWNRFGIGICLVGDFNTKRPTRRQMESAAHLIAYLQQQYGIADANILGHGQVPGARTDCPGKLFPYSEMVHRVQAVRQRAQAGH